MKKILAILALTTITVISLVACDNATQNENNNNNNQSITNQETNNQKNDNKNKEENTSTLISSEKVNNIQPSGEVITEPFNSEVNITEVLNNISTVSGLTEANKMSATKINENFNFGAFKDLQMEIRSVESADTIKEIVLVKIGDNNQAISLSAIMAQRQMDLKAKYADNAKLTEMLNNSENVIIKQQAGIFIGIIAENATEIDAKLQEQF